MERVAIFVDVQNVYYTSRQTYRKNFDYNAFWRKATANRQVVKAVAYAVERGDTKQREFQNILRAIGFEVKLKPFIQRADGSAKGDWDVGITIDMMDAASEADTLILVSGDGDFSILCNRLTGQGGKKVEVYGVPALTAASLMQSASEFISIDQQLLLGQTDLGTSKKKEFVMRKALMIIIATLSLSSHAVADSAQRDTVEALLIASGADSTLDAVYAQFDGMFANMAEQFKIEESERASFKKHMQKVNLMLQEEMNWDTLKEPMIDLYLAHYTEQELQDMLAFYQSETGQSVVKKMPEVMAASMQVTQQLMKDVYPKIMQMSKAYSEELKKQRAAD